MNKLLCACSLVMLLFVGGTIAAAVLQFVAGAEKASELDVVD